MRLITLLENTTKDKTLTPEHGLSIFIETLKHKTLFDLGPDDAFLRNAQRLGVDLTEVDTVVLSHGHYDHGGGLAGFLKINSRAKIYIHKAAFEPYYVKASGLKKYIGLDRDLFGNERFILIDGTVRIDDELLIFSDIDGQFETKSNSVLLKKTAGGFFQDDFAHEQNLIVTESDNAVLLAGCSHRGIANILKAAQKHQPVIRAVLGGFHLYNPIAKSTEPAETVQELAKELAAQECMFYTGHCTGTEAFEIMSAIMRNNLSYLFTGSVIEM